MKKRKFLLFSLINEFCRIFSSTLFLILLGWYKPCFTCRTVYMYCKLYFEWFFSLYLNSLTVKCKQDSCLKSFKVVDYENLIFVQFQWTFSDSCCRIWCKQWAEWVFYVPPENSSEGNYTLNVMFLSFLETENQW